MKTKSERLAAMDTLDPAGKNRAIQRHKAKILAMNDEQYAEHDKALDAKLPVWDKEAKRLAAEFFPKG